MSRRFYGDQKIETVQEDGDFVILAFDKESLRIPKKLYEISVSKEPLNATELWDRQLSLITKETLELWLSWDVKLEQLDYLYNMLKSSIEHSLEVASTKLWGNSLKDRRMSHVDNVLKQDETK